MTSVRVLLHIPMELMEIIDNWVNTLNKKKTAYQKPTNRQAVILAYLDYGLQQSVTVKSAYDRYAWIEGTRPMRKKL